MYLGPPLFGNNGKSLAAFGAAAFQYQPTSSRHHSLEEAVDAATSNFFWLPGSF
jgi:hypothetical protein